MTPFRLVTLNTWKCDGPYRLRLRAMANQLRGLAPDLLALQESFASLDGRHDTARDLAQALDMRWVMLPSRSKLRWCDGEQMPSHSGLALLSRWPITHHVAVELPCAADDGERAALLCQVQLASGSLTVANVHLTHLSQMDALRHAQLKTVLDHPWLGNAGGASGMAGAENAAVVCGDFNAPLQSESLCGFITAGAPWLDAVSAAGMSRKVTCPAAGPQGQDVDHVLSLKTSRLRWSRAFTALEQPDPDTGVLPSDHYAVCVSGQFLP